jgi:hypothetical protein
LVHFGTPSILARGTSLLLIGCIRYSQRISLLHLLLDNGWIAGVTTWAYPPTVALRQSLAVSEIVATVFQRVPGQYAGKAAIDIALFDWVGKKLGVPLLSILWLGRWRRSH